MFCFSRFTLSFLSMLQHCATSSLIQSTSASNPFDLSKSISTCVSKFLHLSFHFLYVSSHPLYFSASTTCPNPHFPTSSHLHSVSALTYTSTTTFAFTSAFQSQPPKFSSGLQWVCTHICWLKNTCLRPLHRCSLLVIHHVGLPWVCTRS